MPDIFKLTYLSKNFWRILAKNLHNQLPQTRLDLINRSDWKVFPDLAFITLQAVF
jgi:hypothetical protein